MTTQTLPPTALPTVSTPPTAHLPSLADLLYDDSGQDLVEYALVATCIGLGTVTGVHGLAASISNYLNVVDGGFNNSLAGTF